VTRPAILQIIPQLDTGGAERTVIDIAAALTAAGFAAPVVSAGGRMEDELRAAGGELIRLPAASKSPWTILSNAGRIEDLVEQHDIKLIHARSRAPAWSGLIAAKATGVPFIATHHGIYGASNALKRLYNSVMVRGAAVIANSEWTAAHIAEQYGSLAKRVVVIPRGVDTARFDPAGIAPERVTALRAAWGADENDVVLLLPGRLTSWKGQAVLIAALAHMKARGTLGRIKAVLAGDAQGRSAYEDELRSAITAGGLDSIARIVGHIEDMATAYLASDIVVSASTKPEAFGRVAAEAGVMGVAVIATDHGGARETILPGVSGLLTLPGEENALADAIETMIARGAEGRRAMGAKARAHILSHYTREAMCAATLALYRELID
jgi:glycosyltransferase involved in cell wall biosynthesis